MCEYCNEENQKEIRGQNYESNIYTIGATSLNIDVTVDIYDKFGNNIIDYEDMQDYITINYCPFCGRKLID